MYCEESFSVEEVKVITASGKEIMYPNLQHRVFTTNKNYLNNIAGVDLEIEEISKLLDKMGLSNRINGDNLEVLAPITRTDILHPCDIAEDLAIAYGYNNIVKRKPTTLCSGYQQPINKLTDLIRLEMSLFGYVECLTMALISKKDMLTNMLKEVNQDTLDKTVQIFKSKTSEFELFRNSLIPGILKTVEANKKNQV
jgi:phenylalanyl-tRNA synthetase beta chain